MSILWDYLKRVFAGAIFGGYMAHLLYFLNPQVDISPGRLVLVTLVYSVICGLLFGTALWILRLLRLRIVGQPDTERTHGFGFVVLAVFVSATIYWTHWDSMRIYLPIAAFRVLSKATNLITITAFALLILWIIERNAGRHASRFIFLAAAIIIGISSFTLYQRRESYRVEHREVVVANIGTVAEKRPAIVVAIRNLPYDWIITMRGEGILPFFEEASRTSYLTRLEPFPTPHWQALWASLATGKLPNRHGVTGRFSYRTALNREAADEQFFLIPRGVGFRMWGLIPPVEQISAQLPSGDALPLWTLYERLGLRAAVVNWPSSAATGASRVITDDVLRAAVRPDPTIQALAPRFDDTGAAEPIILKALATDKAALDAIVDDKRFDLRVVALEGFSEAQRALHIYLNEVPARASTKGEALRAYLQQIDRELAQLVRSNPEHLIIVCSPSAIVPPELAASAYAIAARELRSPDPGADDGFLLFVGPGTVQRPNPETAYVADVVPTVLFAGGLPVGRDMDGRILTEAFGDDFLRRTTLSAIQTYEARQVVVKRRGA
ncbi:MAG TPA: alkaline phosphatase family protein [Thermoanaerobaculia bacterium]|nr:alkaline phosphatase family protein [Thermoanaerobaculia bacterium]